MIITLVISILGLVSYTVEQFMHTNTQLVNLSAKKLIFSAKTSTHYITDFFELCGYASIFCN